MRMWAKYVAVTAVALAAFAVSPARASCAAPWLSIDGGPSTLKVGQTITIRAEGGWGDFPCNDTGGQGDSFLGCGGEQEFEDDATGEPAKNIEIRLYGPVTPRQERVLDARGRLPRADEYVLLDTVDANKDGYFELEVQVPDVEPGRYVIDTPLAYDDAYPLTIRSDGKN